MKLLLLLLLTLNLLNAEKLALLIGNSNYQYLQVLSSPSQDIPALGKKLRAMDFEVKELYDLDEKQMKKAVKDFKQKLYKNPNAIALFYYSGHGSQAYGESYLIPVDGDTRDESDVEADGVKVETIARKMATARTKANILFLDACRDVPTGTMGGTKGLGQVNRQPSSTLILYSTSKNKTAKDNRVFNQTVLEKLALNIPFSSLANDISYAVGQKTNKQQVPELLSTGLPTFYLKSDFLKSEISKNGLQTPSFNNLTDSWVGTDFHFLEGTTDERKFLVLRNYTNGDTKFTDSINVRVGDLVQGKSYIHNNGIADDPNTVADESVTANNVIFRLPGFHIIGHDSSGKNIYESDIESDANGNFYVSHFISASNVTPGTETISDDAVIKSSDGKKFKLQYTADSSYVKSIPAFAGHTSPMINPDALVSKNGNNIGKVRGGKHDSFYLYTAFRIVEASAKNYDLSINKYVEKETTYSNNGQKVEQKNVSATVGEEVIYKLEYKNIQTSAVASSGTKIYDTYDTQKLAITWLDSKCTNNATYSQTKGLITCTALDLAPGQKHAFYFKGVVRSGATGIINNDVEIIPDNNSNPDDNTRNNGDPNRNPKDLDTNGVNDNSNATITVITNPTYDLSINKYVEKETTYSNNGQKVEQKNVSVTEGTELVYRLAYENKSASTGTPTGTKIYDTYDTQKLAITWLDSKCTNNATYSQTKGLITCTALDLAPGQKHTFYFKGVVRSGATGTINNDVEIIPDNNSNLDDNIGNKGDLNRTPNDFDRNGANDDSIAKLRVVNHSNNGFNEYNNLLFLFFILILLIGMMILKKKRKQPQK